MTLKQVRALSPEALQFRVAELRGYTNLKLFSFERGDKISGLWGCYPGGSGHHRGVVPRFDLDDMHRVEQWLFESGRVFDYEDALHQVKSATTKVYDLWHCSALEKRQAFVLALGK